MFRMQPESQSSRGPLLTAVSAIGSVLAAGSCCLPLGPFLAAAGFAGLGSFLEGSWPYLMPLAIALVGFGFWQAHRAKACGQRPGILNRVLLWGSAAVVGASLFAPYVIAGFDFSGRTRLLDASSLGFLRDQFNAASGETRVLLLLSPT